MMCQPVYCHFMGSSCLRLRARAGQPAVSGLFPHCLSVCEHGVDGARNASPLNLCGSFHGSPEEVGIVLGLRADSLWPMQSCPRPADYHGTGPRGEAPGSDVNIIDFSSNGF